MASHWVSVRDHTVHFVLEREGTKAPARVSWEALQDWCAHDWVDQTSLLNAFREMEGRIRQAALEKLERGEDPLVLSKDLSC